jgi:hypothetical protein
VTAELATAAAGIDSVQESVLAMFEAVFATPRPVAGSVHRQDTGFAASVTMADGVVVIVGP